MAFRIRIDNNFVMGFDDVDERVVLDESCAQEFDTNTEAQAFIDEYALCTVVIWGQREPDLGLLHNIRNITLEPLT